MGRPDPNRPRKGQESLFEDLPVSMPDKVLRGRHSEAMDRALYAAKERGHLDDLDEGLATVLRAGATAFDMLESQNRPYGPSKLIDPMVNALREARLTPESRGGETDESIQALLTDMAALDDSDDERSDSTIPYP